MRLSIVKKAPVSQCAPQTAKALQDFVTATIEVTDSDSEVSGNAIVTTGSETPEANTKRSERVHFMRDAENRVSEIRYFALGKWRTFVSVKPGSFAYYLAGSSPEGWFPADGENGTINVKSDPEGRYYLDGGELIVLHQFMGIFN